MFAVPCVGAHGVRDRAGRAAARATVPEPAGLCEETQRKAWPGQGRRRLGAVRLEEK